ASYSATITVSGGAPSGWTFTNGSANVSFTVAQANIVGFANLPKVYAGEAESVSSGYESATAVSSALLRDGTHNKVTAYYAGGSAEVAVTGWTCSTYSASEAGEYEFTATLDTLPGNLANSNNLTATVVVHVAPIQHGIQLDASGFAFPAEKYDYAPPAAREITITSIGVQATGALSAVLSGGDVSAFELSASDIASIEANGSYKITVVPKTGLGKKTYTATLTVEKSANDAANLKSRTYALSFTVAPNDVLGFEPVPDIELSYNEKNADATLAGLPSHVTPILANATTSPPNIGVKWAADASYGKTTPGSYIFTGTLDTAQLGDNYANPHDFTTVTARVVVAEPINAETPMIAENPTDFDGVVGAPPTLEAKVQKLTQEGGALSYQWYSGAVNTYSGAPVQDATGATLTVEDEPGTRYYWYEVTNTNSGTSITGESTAVTRSELVKVTLRYAKLTVKNGVITGGDYDGETLGEYKAGDTVTIKANAAPSGYTLGGWRENTLHGVALPTGTPSEIKITIPAGDAEIEALYKMISYYPQFSVQPGGGETGKDGETEADESDGDASDGNAEAGERERHNPFTDVSEDDWFYSDVEFAYERGLFTGTGEDTFSPGMPMTRSMLVTVLYRLAGGGEWVEDSGVFADVEPGLWYSEAIAWAAKQGIVNGVGDNLFKPDGDITRQELVTALYRYVKWAASNGAHPEFETILGVTGVVPFDDSDVIADWAREAVLWAYDNGIVQGRPGNVFDPKGRATRAEVAAILRRFIVSAEAMSVPEAESLAPETESLAPETESEGE
ncbi:MAG: S-layer homology domain-containing protein, partial [Oscillospiraceae bacterium]|nr:S-layer homology domain-containing protein [Oscillospiraceae bacterium]